MSLHNKQESIPARPDTLPPLDNLSTLPTPIPFQKEYRTSDTLPYPPPEKGHGTRDGPVDRMTHAYGNIIFRNFVDGR